MNDFVFSMMLLGALSSGGSLPFWAVSNKNGIMPEENGAVAYVSAYKPFDQSRTFQWQAGASLAASASFMPSLPGLDAEAPRLMVDELYAGVRWKVLRADLGMMHREREFLGSDPALGSLSVTEGHVVESNNARTMPGYKLVLEPWAVPFTDGHLLLSGIWGDYKTIDDRFVKGALVHRLRGMLTYDSRNHFYAGAGIDHYALWGGVPSDPKYVPIEVNLSNYLRICTGRSASPAGSRNDQMNCLGDHGGAEQLRIGWREDKYEIAFQWEKPYNDKSGMRMNNFPDGVYTLHWSLKDKNSWVSDALVEVHYTMWQSGTIHERETDADGNQINWHKLDNDKKINIFGGDSYFTNGEYKSGWTHFGRPICGPLFFTSTSSAGITTIGNNRYEALHFGISGKLWRYAPYKLMLTASRDYGTYSRPYISPSTWNSGWNWWEKNTIDKGLKQFSAAFTGFVPFRIGRRSSLDVVYGLYADSGELFQEAFAGILGIRFNI
ncbi:MAG: hypothetical protein IKX67_00245 [Bacteroidales bacterium]|nr:hypothetical protein [Bacteroidales bacterium]